MLAVLIPLVAQHSFSQSVGGTGDGRQKRSALVARLVARDHIGKRLQRAFKAVPRERFLPSYLSKMAYEDTSIPLGKGQTLPSPSELLEAVKALGVGEKDSVLVVGADTAYIAALLSRLAAHVFVVDLDPGERQAAIKLYSSLGFTNITVARGSSIGAFASSAPFPRIFVHGAMRTVPPTLLGQLAATGKMVVPLRVPSGLEMVVELEKSKGSTIIHSIGTGFYSPISLSG